MLSGFRLAGLAMVLLLLSGCASPPAAPAPAVAERPLRLQLSGCAGWQVASTPLPTALAPARPPPGWEDPDPTAVSAVLMMGYRCDRISLGAFERGPVQLVLDTHGWASVPAACRSSAGIPLVLASAWVDDAEVAAFLNATYGLPVRAAHVASRAQVAGDVAQHTWEWGAPGDRPSTLTVLDDGTRSPYRLDHELLWQRGAGVGALEVAYDRDGPSPAANRAAYGDLQPPALLASQGGAFAGQGAWFPAASMQGTFHLYRDLACAQPEA